MKITDLRTRIVHLDFRNCVIVQVDTDEGITGISETVMKRKTLTIEQSILQLKPYLIGKDPTEIETHWESMYRDSFWVGGPMHATAISAIDCALWDILGRMCGVPVHKLLGGPTRRKVPVYCHCPGGSSPSEFARHALSCVERGYRNIKTTLPLFYGASNSDSAAYSGTNGSISRTWKETEHLSPGIFRRIREFFAAAREAVGPEIGLAVDCHGRLPLKGAFRLCDALEDLDMLFIEEPVPPENVESFVKIQQHTSIPIAGGERWATIHGAREFIEREAVDILQSDLVNCGGITGLKKMAAMAEAHSITMAPHNPNGPIATVMNLHFAAAVPNYFMLETIGSDSDAKLWQDLIGWPLRLDDGYMQVPCEPGFGVELDEDAAALHPYVPHEGWR
ncbi:MAG TPA: mandelate racemase/muconate lactonizing enzyme family protein [Bryobacteraceae bacterium]|nr:mandelate racemase/muconate lactonizing enzyme family protein [Bryobacteraceae bacterium]